MEPNFRNRRSSSADRFLGVFSQPPSETTTGDELNEDEVFWTGDFTEPNPNRSVSPSSSSDNPNHHRLGFRQPENFGILAAMPEKDDRTRSLRDRPVLYRKTPISSSSAATASFSRMIPAIPKPPQMLQEREYSQSVPSRKFNQSAPMNVPVLSKAMAKAKGRVNSELIEDVEGDDGEDEMLPPHEIVARGSATSPKTTFSVLEGVGRTLKGRDLRQVRNAVWRQTGFLD